MAKVAWANKEATIHVYFDNNNRKEDFIKSVTLLPGEFIPLTDLPNHMREIVTRGDAAGISLRDVTLNKREKKEEQAVEEIEE